MLKKILLLCFLLPLLGKAALVQSTDFNTNQFRVGANSVMIKNGAKLTNATQNGSSIASDSTLNTASNSLVAQIASAQVWTNDGTNVFLTGNSVDYGSAAGPPYILRNDGSVFQGINANIYGAVLSDFSTIYDYGFFLSQSNAPSHYVFQKTVGDYVGDPFLFRQAQATLELNLSSSQFSLVGLQDDQGRQAYIDLLADPDGGTHIKLLQGDDFKFEANALKTTNTTPLDVAGLTTLYGGVASFSTNATITVVTTGITNNTGREYRLFGLTGVSVLQTNTTRSVGFSRGTITTPSDVVLQSGEFVTGTSIAVQGHQAF